MKRIACSLLALMLILAACQSTPKNGNGEGNSGGESADSTERDSGKGQSSDNARTDDQGGSQSATETDAPDNGTSTTPTPRQLERNVSFTTGDGVKINATLHLPEGEVTGGVVCLPMYRRTRETFKPAVPSLVKQGIVVLAIDPRGHGESGTPEHAEAVLQRKAEVFQAMTADVAGAIRELRTRYGVGSKPVGLLGASAGAAVAVLYAAEKRDVAAIALLSPGDYMGLDVSGQASNVRARVLITTEDTTTADPIYSALFGSGSGLPEYHQDSLKDARKRIAEHGTDQLNKEYGIEDKLAEFFARTLR